MCSHSSVLYRRFLATILMGVVVAGGAEAQTSISVYLSAPRSQTSSLTSITTETFNSLSTGNRTSNYTGFGGAGTYALSSSNPFAVVADDQYGNGTSRYISLGAQSGTSSPFTLTFSSTQDYFGFAWCAGDNTNGMSFYNGSTFLGRFSTATINTLLSASTVTALGGTVYSSSTFFGKPTAGTLNTGEPYSFVNFFSSGGSFNKIVFDNSGTTASGFEMDNHTIRTLAGATPENTYVFVTQVVVPEPGTRTLFLLGGLSLVLRQCKRKKR